VDRKRNVFRFLPVFCWYKYIRTRFGVYMVCEDERNRSALNSCKFPFYLDGLWVVYKDQSGNRSDPCTRIWNEFRFGRISLHNTCDSFTCVNQTVILKTCNILIVSQTFPSRFYSLQTRIGSHNSETVAIRSASRKI
jgi:hypothetical protein